LPVDRELTSNQQPATNNPDSGLRPGEFWANNDISFELRRGECLGLIGHNGAGKTTLLKMLNGLIKPDEGTIEMRGRVGALIALGAGFNPILTGRENIYVNGSILGLTKEEIDAKTDDIIEFAEIRDFIDSPVQSYSSGMQVRLGFSVATALDPDILILDEVLAVGDVSFKVKCFKRIADMKRKCATIFVSHDALLVAKICSQATWLERGKQLKTSNDVHGILNEYEEKITMSSGSDLSNKDSHTYDGFKITIDNIEAKPTETTRYDARVPHTLRIHLPALKVRDGVDQCEIRIIVVDAGQNPVLSLKSIDDSGDYNIFSKDLSKSTVTEISIPILPVADGIYTIRIAVMPKHHDAEIIFFREVATRISVYGYGRQWSRALLFCEYKEARN